MLTLIMMRRIFPLFLLAILACTVSTRSPMPPAIRDTLRAELVFQNGSIYTLDPAYPKAQAIACRQGRIIGVGTNDEIRKFVDSSTTVIDLGGKTVVPGLVDAHCHTDGLGFWLQNVQLNDAASFDDVVRMTQEKLKSIAPGQWIRGRGWNQEHWPVQEFPTHHKLSQATPNNPVWYRRIDGHAGLANRKAMELAGVTSETPDPAGGKIIHGSNGEPTGVFVDTAMGYIEGKIPSPTIAEVKERILLAQEACLKLGQTGLHDAGLTADLVEAFTQLAAEGKLKIRFYGMILGSEKWIIEYMSKNSIRIGSDSNRLTIRAVKMIADGALGSRGAWLLEPYEDQPKDEKGAPYTGLPVTDPASIRRVATEALKRGYQVCVHAIGDRGNRETLNAFEAALKQAPVPDHRFRLEHAQITHPDDIKRCAALGVVPSMQPTHATSDMWMAEKRLGKHRLAGAYAWQKFLKAGCRLAGGSDFPIESHNPMLGFYAAVTRQDDQGRPEGGWLPQERLSREEALRCFALDACYAAFEETVKGSLEIGKYADFLVLSNDIMTCPPKQILTTQVEETIINGEVVYQK